MNIQISHCFNEHNKEIYTAMYLDGILLVDWTPKFTEINEKHPAIIEAEHRNLVIKD